MLSTENMDVVRQALLALADRTKGTLTPQRVVKAAEDERSPLHDYFEWDDTKASDKYRLLQARVLIKRVRVVIETTELAPPKRIPVFGIDPRSGAYATLDNLRNDPDAARESALIELKRAGNAMKRARQVSVELGLGAEAYEQLTAMLRNLEVSEKMFRGLA